jgi:hypothetical protein
MGQIRNFFQDPCLRSFQEFIQRLKEDYSKVVVFLYIFKYDPWEYIFIVVGLMFFCNRSISIILEDHLDNDRYLTVEDNFKDMTINFMDNNTELVETHYNTETSLRTILIHNIYLYSY